MLSIEEGNIIDTHFGKKVYDHKRLNKSHTKDNIAVDPNVVPADILENS
jgi:hypothetical protein